MPKLLEYLAAKAVSLGYKPSYADGIKTHISHFLEKGSMAKMSLPSPWWRCISFHFMGPYRELASGSLTLHPSNVGSPGCGGE